MQVTVGPMFDPGSQHSDLVLHWSGREFWEVVTGNSEQGLTTRGEALLVPTPPGHGALPRAASPHAPNRGSSQRNTQQAPGLWNSAQRLARHSTAVPEGLGSWLRAVVAVGDPAPGHEP